MLQPTLTFKVTQDDFDDKRFAVYGEDANGNSMFLGYGRTQMTALKAAKRNVKKLLCSIEWDIKFLTPEKGK